MVPRGSPGKVRLKFSPSTGEVRWPAITAWTLFAGIRMRRPWTRPGSRSRIRSQIVIGPSYSSPWLPPSMITVGPVPFLITAIGTRVAPQASSCGECGIIRKPVCLPSRSRSTVRKALDGRGVGLGRAALAVLMGSRRVQDRDRRRWRAVGKHGKAGRGGAPGRNRYDVTASAAGPSACPDTCGANGRARRSSN